MPLLLQGVRVKRNPELSAQTPSIIPANPAGAGFVWNKPLLRGATRQPLASATPRSPGANTPL